MIRRISTKWMLAVLFAVVTPFLGYAFFVDRKMAERLSGDVVEQYLLSMAADLAYRIDTEIEERRLDAELLAQNAMLEWYLGDYDEDQVDAFKTVLMRTFEAIGRQSQIYDLIIAVDANGAYKISSKVDARGRLFSAEHMAKLVDHDYSGETWFQEALETGHAQVDQHRSPLLPGNRGSDIPLPDDFSVGFATRIGTSDVTAEPVGVVYLLMSWRRIQHEVTNYGVRQLRSDNAPGGEALVGEDIYQSSYAWIWGSDADTILAHPKRELYGMKVSGPEINLPQMTAAANAGSFGMYPDYVFRGEEKKAAFKRCKGPEEGGFGWVVGVGVDADDIYAPVRDLSGVLYSATAVTLFLAVLLTAVIARRTTRPILELRQHTERLARGDLDARIEVRSNDELGDLARAFNRMTAELSENRAQLVRAEKDAAWREMARQVAHEIKNPLTPISLAVGLLQRAHAEKSPDFDGILARTLDMIHRQVQHMRDITKDFHALAGQHAQARAFDAEPIVREVLELESAWAAEQRVSVRARCVPARLLGDPDDLRRAVINLVSNALEAMPEGGELEVDLESLDGRVVLTVGDTGRGLSDEVKARLFEPYFTTRSAGTGLGLAIVRRVIEEMGGSVTLENRSTGQGAVARIELPAHV